MPLIDEPVKVDFGADANKALEEYVWNQLQSLIDGHRLLFTSSLSKWRNLYAGKPEYEQRNFPWPNASNLVIQIIGQYTDMLLARMLAAIWEVPPLWTMGLVGSWGQEEQGEEQRAVVEEFMNNMGLEKGELDLYRVEYETFHDTIKFGFQVVKAPWETDIEQKVVGIRGKDIISDEYTKYDGPRPEKIKYENFLITPQAKTLETAEFKAHIITLTKYKLEERRFRGLYDENAIDQIIQQPDRSGPTQTAIASAGDETAVTVSGYENAEWDLYECWFPYIHNNKKYRIIYTYHFKTRTVMRNIFNFYPDNEECFVSARLGYEGDTIRGRGFCSMLEDYQEEISTVHNQDIDASTLANTNAFRVSPESRLDAMFQMYPSCVIPARDGEFEVFQLGRTNPDSLARQQLIMQMINERAGVAPPTMGAGSGSAGKNNSYSALGTLSILQQGNHRTNINAMDMRYFHTNLGRMLLRYYSYFGIGADRLRVYGEKADLLQKAMSNIEKKRITLPIRASSASMNREVEKQNDMLLMNLTKGHYTWIGNMLQALPQAPPHMQDYILKTIMAANLLAKDVIRNFGHEDVSRFIPDANIVKELLNGRGRDAGAVSGQPVEAVGANAIPPAAVQA